MVHINPNAPNYSGDVARNPYIVATADAILKIPTYALSLSSHLAPRKNDLPYRGQGQNVVLKVIVQLQPTQ